MSEPDSGAGKIDDLEWDLRVGPHMWVPDPGFATEQPRADYACDRPLTQGDAVMHEILAIYAIPPALVGQ